MSGCKEITKLLSDFLDRELPRNACIAIEQHLDSCTDCRQAADTLRTTIELCRQYRNQQRPSPLSPDKERELKEVLQKSLANLEPNSSG
jgi:predicted anti-sigma-YlaC factor YlaD